MNDYEEGIKAQKFMGSFFIFCGTIFTLTIIGAIIGIPMIIIGIGFRKSKQVNGVTGLVIKNQIK